MAEVTTGQGDAVPRPGKAAARGPNRSVLFVVVGIAALVVVTILVLLRPAASPTEFPAYSPVGVYQRYLAAVERGDADAAFALLSSDARSSFPLEEMQNIVREAGRYGYDPADRSVSLVDTRESGDRTTLRLQIKYLSEPGLFNSGNWTSDETVVLVKEDGAWRLTDPWVGGCC
jgi:hypothetical protein